MCFIGVWDDHLGFVAQDALDVSFDIPDVAMDRRLE